MIKYDTKEQRLFLIGSLIWPVLKVVQILSYIFNWEEIYICVCTLTLIAPLVSLSFFNQFLKACAYFKRLRDHGYIIPYDKMDYDCMLERLPRIPNVVPKSPSRECVIFAGVYAVASVVMFLFSRWFFLIHYAGLGKERIVLFCIWNCFTLLLAFHAVRLYKERDRNEYRDDVEVDVHKKKRHHAI